MADLDLVSSRRMQPSAAPPKMSGESLSGAWPLLLSQTGSGFLYSMGREKAIVFIQDPDTSLYFPTPWYQQAQMTASGPGELTP